MHLQDQFSIDELIKSFDDPEIDEIFLNGLQGVWIWKRNSFEYSPSPFQDEIRLIRSIQEFAFARGVRLDPMNPGNGGILVNPTLRWHCVLPPITTRGPIFCLRRHRFETTDVTDFSISDEACGVLKKWFINRQPIILCGPTGSGKTTLMAALLKTFAGSERIFCVEQLAEIPPLTNHWIGLVERQASVDGIGGFSLSRILEESLRLRPDRIVVGEIRGGEAETFLHALNTGHGGVLTTLHAGSPKQAEERIKALSANEKTGEILEEAGALVCIMERGIPPKVESLAFRKDANWHLLAR